MQSIFSVEENLSHARSTEFNAYAAGSTSATATKAAVAATIYKCTWATFYADTDSLLQIKDDNTVIWEIKLVVATYGKGFHVTFPTPLIGAENKDMSALVVSSSADCFVAFGGFSTKP